MNIVCKILKGATTGQIFCRASRDGQKYEDTYRHHYLSVELLSTSFMCGFAAWSSKIRELNGKIRAKAI